MGDLIRMPYSEVTSTLELLDRWGVTPRNLEDLRKCSSWGQQTTARVLMADPFLMAILGIEWAAKKAGFTESDFERLAGTGQENLLQQILQVVRGFAEIKAMEHVIDCDADPFVPEGWKVEKHQKGGSFKWDPKQVQFYLSKSQKKGSYIEGNKLRTELEGKPVLNANVLDYLLAHPHIIPEEWKQDEQGRTRYIFFWGTEYRHSHGLLFVRFLFWKGDRWHWYYYWLDFDWFDSNPAALRAS